MADEPQRPTGSHSKGVEGLVHEKGPLDHARSPRAAFERAAAPQEDSQLSQGEQSGQGTQKGTQGSDGKAELAQKFAKDFEERRSRVRNQKLDRER